MIRVRVVLDGKLWGIIPVRWTVTLPLPDSNIVQSQRVSAGPLKGTLSISQMP